MDEPLAPHPRAEAEAFHEVNSHLLQNARAHAALDVVPALPLKNDGVDPGLAEQES